MRAARDAGTAEPDARWIPYLPLGAAGRYLQPTGFGTLGYAPPVLVFDNGGYGENRDEMTARGDTPRTPGPTLIAIPEETR
ncbi:hypothetical protein [Streptomyces sp. NBC_00203]|uniref:hypothetical protein n=1 Tax=Streptomyces sp. NBC_00203 TaxID=2975680 RepID=UPI003247936C